MKNDLFFHLIYRFYSIPSTILHYNVFIKANYSICDQNKTGCNSSFTNIFIYKNCTLTRKTTNTKKRLVNIKTASRR